MSNRANLPFLGKGQKNKDNNVTRNTKINCRKEAYGEEDLECRK